MSCLDLEKLASCICERNCHQSGNSKSYPNWITGIKPSDILIENSHELIKPGLTHELIENTVLKFLAYLNIKLTSLMDEQKQSNDKVCMRISDAIDSTYLLELQKQIASSVKQNSLGMKDDRKNPNVMYVEDSTSNIESKS